MRNHGIRTIASLLFVCAGILLLAVAPGGAQEAIATRTFDFTPERAPGLQYFMMESKLITYALDGKRVSTDVFRLRLKCAPASTTGRPADEYTCAEFTVQFAGATEVSLPMLRDWKYLFGPATTGIDDKGQVFGIDHSRFEKLADADGKDLPLDKAYHVYNAFIDFHAFCNVFARPAPDGGKGIQDLKRIGDRIVHAAAFSEAPVNLGSHVAEGSTFKNGEITLELKGLSAVAGATCAMVGYDSGDSSFKMMVKPMPNMEVKTTGSSHYKGDIYIDLASQWVRKATMYELAVTETKLPMPPNKINAVIERDILIRNVTAQEFTGK